MKMKRRRASSATTLPDELVVEILARVTDVAGLFRCATACKRWRRLIADPFFLVDIWPKRAHHPPSSVVGVFLTKRRPVCYGEKRIMNAPAFVPLPRLAISFGSSSMVSFPPGNDAGFLDGTVTAVTSRGGLLLVRLTRREPAGHPSQSVDRLAVCDPIAGTTDLLPPLIYQGWRVQNYAILTDADLRSSGVVQRRRQRPLPGYSAFFKVIAMVVKSGMFKIYTFCSSEPEWSTRYQRFEKPDGGRELISCWPDNAVVRHGTPHWLIYNMLHHYALSVSGAETSHALLTKISIPVKHFNIRVHDFPHLRVTSGGALSLFWLHKDGRRLETWTRQDDRESNDDGAGWFPSLIELNLPEQRQMNGPACLITEMNGVLLIKDNVKRVYVVDINTGAPVMEEVTDSFREMGCIWKAVPFEVDLPAFFLSKLKLGGRLR
nr:uncharacterized protein LOC127347472 [Lolium perenne]